MKLLFNKVCDMAVFDILNPLKNVTLKFTEEQVVELNEWFEEKAQPILLVNDDETPLPAVSVEKVLEFLALKKYHKRHFSYPTYIELMTEVEKLTPVRLLTREQFIYLLDKWNRVPELKHEVILAFQVFDTEKRNMLEIDEIAQFLTSYGDPFTDEEVREIVRDANIRGDGNVCYEDFVESIFTVCPEISERVEAEYLYINADEDPSVPPDPEPEPEPEPEEPPPPPPPPPPKKGGKKK